MAICRSPASLAPHSDWQLRVTAFARATRDELAAHRPLRASQPEPRARYRFGSCLRSGRFRSIRPLQFLNIDRRGEPVCGDVDWDGTALRQQRARKSFRCGAPGSVCGSSAFDSGPVPTMADRQRLACPPRACTTPAGYASAALGYRHRARARQGGDHSALVVPLSGAGRAAACGSSSSTTGWRTKSRTRSPAGVRGSIACAFVLPRAAAPPLIDTLRTALAHILITRDGPILRPGNTIVRALVDPGRGDDVGIAAAARAVQASRPIICAGSRRISSPTARFPAAWMRAARIRSPENDSDGRISFSGRTKSSATARPALAAALWPHVDGRGAAISMHCAKPGARSTTSAPEHRGFLRLAAGIDQPRGLCGKTDAFLLGRLLGGERLRRRNRSRAPARARRRRRPDGTTASDEFDRDLAASLRAATAAHGISFLPGAAELGDFDPASTAIGLAPGAAALDPSSPLVRATFERYWQEFVARRDGRESVGRIHALRAADGRRHSCASAGASVRTSCCSFFLAGRRPQAWNQWAEVVGRDARKPRFIGDMPHAWVASDFIGAVLDLFAYEREADHALVLARGIPPAWLDGPGIAVHDLRTPYGLLTYRLRRDHARTILRIDRGSGLPPGGFVFAWSGATADSLPRASTASPPYGGPASCTSTNSRRQSWSTRLSRIPRKAGPSVRRRTSSVNPQTERP